MVDSIDHDEARFAQIRRKLWVPYKQAQEVEQLVASLQHGPTPLRARSVLVWGPPGAGKSALGQRILRQLSPNPEALDGEISMRAMPILTVEAPTLADEPALYDAILEGLGAFRPRGTARTLQNAVYDHLSELRPWLMIMDEIHNLNAFFGVRGQICLNAIRRLCNVHRIALLCLGTAAAQTVINSDEQLQHRFAIFQLAPLERDEFEQFGAKLSAVMPLKVTTQWTRSMFDRAYELSEGFPGRFADLIQDAAMLAAETGAEQLTEDILESTILASRLRGRDVSRKRAGRQVAR